MERNSWAWDLDPAGRSYALREAFWRREPERYLIQERLEGCGEETLVGHARDFAAWLDASPPSIQPLDLLAGVALKSVGRVDLRKASHGSVLDLAFHELHPDLQQHVLERTEHTF